MPNNTQLVSSNKQFALKPPLVYIPGHLYFGPLFLYWYLLCYLGSILSLLAAQMSSCLASTSDESLALITSFISAHDLARLWFCGYRALNNRLSRSVRIFDLKYNERSALIWPKLISCFSGLKKLFIRSNELGINGAFIRNVDYRIVPRSIRQMGLFFANGLLSLITLPLPSLCRRKFVPRLRFNVIERFPELRNLEWTNSYHKTMATWDFSEFLASMDGDDTCPLGILDAFLIGGFSNKPRIYKRYPRHLQGLKVSMEDWSGFSLPPNLTHLTCRWNGWEHLLPSFPTGLVSLHLQRLHPHNNSLEWQEQWSNLSRLVNLTTFTGSFHSILPWAVHCLPPSVLSITLGATYFDINSLACLPPKLEKLCILSPVFLRLEDFYEELARKKLLENSETSLQYAESDDDRAMMDFSPSSNQSLLSDGLPQFDSCERLPQSLTSVSTVVLPIFTPSLWHTMPRQLRTILGVDGVSSELIPIFNGSIEQIVSLPPQLRHWSVNQILNKDELVQLSSLLSSRPSKLELDLLNFDDPEFASMKDFAFVSPPDDYLSALNGFTSLVSLRISGTSTMLPLHPLNDFKGALVHLTIKFPSTVCPKGTLEGLNFAAPWARYMEALEFPSQWLATLESPIDWFASLPPTLTSFTAEHFESIMLLPADILLHLPSSLVSLVAYVKDLSSIHIKSLPRSLERITLLGSSRPDLCLNDLLSLPRSVTSLFMPPSSDPSWKANNSDWIRRNTRLNTFICGDNRGDFMDFDDHAFTSTSTLSLAIEQTLAENPEEPVGNDSIQEPKRRPKRTRTKLT